MTRTTKTTTTRAPSRPHRHRAHRNGSGSVLPHLLFNHVLFSQTGEIKDATIHEQRKAAVITATALLADLAWMVSKYAAGVSGVLMNGWVCDVFKEAEDQDHVGRVLSMAYDHTQDLLYLSLNEHIQNLHRVAVPC